MTTMTKTRFPIRRLAALLAVLATTGCATKGDLRNLQLEIRNLGLRQDSLLAEIRSQTRSTQDTVRQTSDQLFQIRGDVSSRLLGLETSIDRLSEMVGQMQSGIVDLRDQVGSGAMGRSQRSLGGDPLGGSSSGDAIDLYNAAIRSYNMSQWTAARFGFESFLEAHPSDDLVPSAYYYLGEVFIQLGDSEGAIEAYQMVTRNYPNSDQVPAARLGLGLTYLDQGETALARNQFETVINTWPNSEAAASAREALAGMGGLSSP